MSEQETEKILSQLAFRGIKPGLERMEKLMHALGDPQKKFHSIHVTGTNGKGSVCAMLESILHCAGIRVGLYTSPHLIEVYERIRFKKQNISHSDFNRWVKTIWNCARQVHLDRDLTYFEMLTAVAFCFLAEKEVEIAVIEVGLGGRLDATNIIPSPEVCVITNISLEHTQILGKTVEKIAKEKAGIVKRNSACVTAAEGLALDTIRTVCFDKDVCLVRVQDGNSQVRTLAERCSLKGEFQKQNIAVVIRVIELLREKEWSISQDQICTGLQETFLQGRFQKMRLGTNAVLLDGAHNPAAIKALVSAIHFANLREKNCILIFNSLKDKDIEQMIRILVNNLKISKVIIPALATERTTNPKQMEKMFIPHLHLATFPPQSRTDSPSYVANNRPSSRLYRNATPFSRGNKWEERRRSIQTFPSVQKSWEMLASKKELFEGVDWILVTGSLYLIGETLKSGFLKPKPECPLLLKEYV